MKMLTGHRLRLDAAASAFRPVLLCLPYAPPSAPLRPPHAAGLQEVPAGAAVHAAGGAHGQVSRSGTLRPAARAQVGPGALGSGPFLSGWDSLRQLSRYRFALPPQPAQGLCKHAQACVSCWAGSPDGTFWCVLVCCGTSDALLPSRRPPARASCFLRFSSATTRCCGCTRLHVWPSVAQALHLRRGWSSRTRSAAFESEDNDVRSAAVAVAEQLAADNGALRMAQQVGGARTSVATPEASVTWDACFGCVGAGALEKRMPIHAAVRAPRPARLAAPRSLLLVTSAYFQHPAPFPHPVQLALSPPGPPPPPIHAVCHLSRRAGGAAGAA